MYDEHVFSLAQVQALGSLRLAEHGQRLFLINYVDSLSVQIEGHIAAPAKTQHGLAIVRAADGGNDIRGQWLLQRVDSGPILRGLWLPPLAELGEGAQPVQVAIQLLPVEPISPPKLGPIVRHNITHRKIDVIPIRIDASQPDLPNDAWRWVNPDDPGLPTSSLLQKLVDIFRVKS